MSDLVENLKDMLSHDAAFTPERWHSYKLMQSESMNADHRYKQSFGLQILLQMYISNGDICICNRSVRKHIYLQL